uniref:Low-density lipoprotein receptor-related protein 2-like n=1 Tax=Myripristis murdjan TaxID=586833 RepID=A0A667WW69_9TELE
MTLWDQRDGSRIQDVNVGSNVFGVMTALKDVKPVPNTPDCNEPSMLCPHSSVCLPPSKLCDGKNDCPDGTDEKLCFTTCPNKGDFKCTDSRSCIPESHVCDGRAHCYDSSDEVNCPTAASIKSRPDAVKCRNGYTSCKDGRECVLYTHLCDGERDCLDGSDEQGCGAPEQKMTPNKPEVHPSNQTPATKHPIMVQPPCSSPSVLCPGASVYLCISPDQFCNGREDCPDGFDEKQCVKKCPSRTDFRCKDRRSCVSKSLVCNGRSDCHDGSDEVSCPTAPSVKSRPDAVKCRNGYTSCKDGRECVLYTHLCDGERDCQDGSDEQGCGAPEQKTTPNKPEVHPSNQTPATKHPITVQPPCSSPSVLCPGASVYLCISPDQFCNGRKDCPDGFDEKQCVKKCPSRTDFRCKDRRSCVSKSLVCDGRSDCHDGSDEVNCPTAPSVKSRPDAMKCRNGYTSCKDGRECVLYTHLCDGERDCQDGSDEQGCGAPEQKTTPNKPEVHPSNPTPATKRPITVQPPCSSPSVLCPGASVLLCISPDQFCNGRKDCPDGFDEKQCVKKCPSRTDFHCKDRRSCVSKSLVCDGRSDCHDGSDEVNCLIAPSITSRPDAVKCRKGSKPCKDGRECVLYTHLCDGERDCQDGSDEQGCQKTCKEAEFQCAHGRKCIPQAYVCDGESQCQDKSDELNCWKSTKSCQHRCDDNKRCVPKSFLCDGERDCKDGTDEDGCNLITDAAASTEPPALTFRSTCVSPSLLCPGSSLCISKNQMCDGQKDCPDGFDEDGCIFKCKNPADFLCGDRRKCIPGTVVCDGRAHCADASDEKNCKAVDPDTLTLISAVSAGLAPLKCRKGFKPCKDGRECVLHSHLCDGEMDCQDGSDEQDCDVQCKAAEFQCSHGKRCIPLEQVCDGWNNCQDRSDEMNCSRRGEGCHHHCDNNSRCIPETFLCDGERDCRDGSDEEKCGLITCESGQFRCSSGQCVSEALRCDGYADCFDRSDEEGCAKPPRCPPDLRCPHSHECLQREWLCDGEDDCKDGSDEKNCAMPTVRCKEYQWKCGNTNQCIPVSWRCDGTKDCHNGMDEDKCDQAKCRPPLYSCGSGECVDPSLLCNTITNCADGSDEGLGCFEHNCSSPSAPRCDHHCVSTPQGPKCRCASGFTLHSSGLTCVDIDECNAELHEVCKHSCLNTRGSYICHCHPGFYLQPDNKSCRTKDEPLLLASVQSELLIFGVQSGTLRLLFSGSRPVFSLDYHWAQQRVYWLSSDYQSIRWADVNNSKNKGTLIKGVKSDLIALDWVGNNLYWVDELVGQIVAVRLSNTTIKPHDYTVVLGEDVEQPSSLVLLPQRGLMLWSEIGSTPHIEQCGMDGSKRKVVVSRDLSWPVSLAVDLLDDRLYWVDEKLRCIGSSSLDGNNVKILQLAETPSPFSVAVFNDRVFWSDTKRRTIRSADKITGKDQRVLLKRPGQPFGLKLMHPLSQPAISNPCEQLNCSHFCLLAPASRGRSRPAAARGPAAVCRCPTGMTLSKDKFSCSPSANSAFILLLSRKAVTQIHLHSIRDSVALNKLPTNRVLALPGITEASALDAAIQGLSLYVADAGQGTVDLLKLSSTRSRQRLTHAENILKLKDDSVTAMAVDWVTSNLYWSSARRPDLHVTSIHDGYTTSLLQGSLKGTTSIALHPASGRLCYTAIGAAGGRSQPQVDCSYMDGRNQAVLWRKSSIPTSLVFSSEGKIIYWADIGEGVISSIGVDGSGYRRYETGTGVLVSFTHIENRLLWVTMDKNVTRVWFSDGVEPKQMWFETKHVIVEMRAYSNNSQAGTNSCSNNNGDCLHLCLAYPRGRTCKCGRDFHPVNVTSCVALPRCPARKKPCLDGSRCIDSARFCDGRVDCPDQSDEQDCPFTNSDLFVTQSKDELSAKSSSSSSSSSSHPAGQKDSSLSVQKNSSSCDDESCKEKAAQGNHVAVVLSVLCLTATFAACMVFCAKRKTWKKFPSLGSRGTETDTLMANMGMPSEFYDPVFEEAESPVDMNAAVELQSLNLKQT